MAKESKSATRDRTKDAAQNNAAPSVQLSAKKYQKIVPKIKKRDGSVVAFDFEKVMHAIEKAMASTGEGDKEEAEIVAHQVVGELVQVARTYKNILPEVEGIQDSIERYLILNDYVQTAKAFILYRDKQAQTREDRVEVPEHVKELVSESKQYFEDNPLGEFVYLRTYARWIPDEGRRETWIETVDRYMNFMKQQLGDKISNKDFTELRQAILEQKIMPSMRMMQFAGGPIERCNTCAYNCAFIAPSKLTDFAEIMYLSMQGCGVGFSVEAEGVEQLPQINVQTGKKLDTYVVPDSKEGWCDALTLGLKTWYAGNDIDFDFSQIRPAGARLKTMGGKASGPEPLRSLLQFARERIMERGGRRLRPIDAHDIICKIGECVVAGGVRRSAMISLSDLDDADMRRAKYGQFYMTEPQRAMANNSAIYHQKPSSTELMDEWLSLMKSGSGERGLFNRGALPTQLPKRRVEYWKETGYIDEDGRVRKPAGTNPCGEIILKSKQFCNLTEVVARADDTEETLLEKARLATILGTYQSTLTNFKYVSQEWIDNCEAERLLGVSITGQWDCETVRNAEMLDKMRKETIKTNKRYAKKFDIPTSNAITTVKPSGTVSQTIDSSSGMHPRYSKYYIRRIRISATDSLFKMLRDQGVPFHPEVGQTHENANTYVLEFPVKAPKGAPVTEDLSAIDQLEHWKLVKENYTEHNPSVTVSVGPDEWISVVDWVYKNWSLVGGLSFLPRNDHVYQLAPYEACDKETFDRLSKNFENLDYSRLYEYERKDETEMKKELACVSGTCEI